MNEDEEEWIKMMKANTMKEARKGNGLEKYMARVIDGELEPEELHSTTLTMGEEESIEWMLTSGAQIEWYFFGNYNWVRNEYKNVDLHRENQRTSGEEKYAQKWLEVDTITYKFSEVRRVNAKINTVCNMIEGIRKTQTKGKRGNEGEVKK